MPRHSRLTNRHNSTFPIIFIPQHTHLLGRHQVAIHPALQVRFAQHATFVVVDAFVRAQTAEVLLHYGLAFGVVVQGKAAALWWEGFAELLAAAGGAKG